MKTLNDNHHDNDQMNCLNLFDDDPLILSFHNLWVDNQLLA
jgi:hypothetical protein